MGKVMTGKGACVGCGAVGEGSRASSKLSTAQPGSTRGTAHRGFRKNRGVGSALGERGLLPSHPGEPAPAESERNPTRLTSSKLSFLFRFVVPSDSGNTMFTLFV